MIAFDKRHQKLQPYICFYNNGSIYAFLIYVSEFRTEAGLSPIGKAYNYTLYITVHPL